MSLSKALHIETMRLEKIRNPHSTETQYSLCPVIVKRQETMKHPSLPLQVTQFTNILLCIPNKYTIAKTQYFLCRTYEII